MSDDDDDNDLPPPNRPPQLVRSNAYRLDPCTYVHMDMGWKEKGILKLLTVEKCLLIVMNYYVVI